MEYTNEQQQRRNGGEAALLPNTPNSFSRPEVEEESTFAPFHFESPTPSAAPTTSYSARTAFDQLRKYFILPSFSSSRKLSSSFSINTPLQQDDSVVQQEPSNRILQKVQKLVFQGYRVIKRDFVPESIWLILTLLGASLSVAAWIIDEIIDLLLDMRNDIGKLPKKLGDRNEFLYNLDDTTSFMLWWMWALFWGLFAVTICKYLSPQAEGLSLEQIRSILAGFAIPGYLDVYTMVAKILGLIAVQAAGLNLGNEGTFVHIACGLACIYLDFPMFKELKQNRQLQRQVLSAACATGISSIFGSPVGGVLFAIEITSSVYHTADYWKAFYTAVLCKFLYAALSQFGNARVSQISLFPTDFDMQPFLLWEIPLFFLLSTLCGFLGGFFVKFSLRTMAMSRMYFNVWAWTVCVVSLHAIINWWFGQFMKRSLASAISDLLVKGEMIHDSTVSGDPHLNSLDWGQPNLFINLIVFGMLNTFLFMLSMSLQVPTGTLIPMFAIGMAIGRFFGEFIKLLGLSSAMPGGYALVGASAFVAGCTGATSTAVIMFEITGQLSFMVPILLAVVVGRASGEVIFPDLYEALQIFKNLPNIPPLSRQKSYAMQARYLMNENNVPCVPRMCSASHLQSAVLRSSTTGTHDEDLFAMVNNDQDRFYLASCTRAQLKHALSQQQPEAEEEEERGEVAVIDLLQHMTIKEIAPACITSTPAIDLIHLFEQSLAPTIFVTKQSRVVGYVDLAAIRYLIEHHNL